jgi:hypothetical protein
MVRLGGFEDAFANTYHVSGVGLLLAVLPTDVRKSVDCNRRQLRSCATNLVH